MRMNDLRVGKRYSFQFTHKRNLEAIVCEVDLDNKRFVIYNSITKEYEGIPSHRFINAEVL